MGYAAKRYRFMSGILDGFYHRCGDDERLWDADDREKHDALLDEMDSAWWDMTDAERQTIDPQWGTRSPTTGALAPTTGPRMGG